MPPIAATIGSKDLRGVDNIAYKKLALYFETYCKEKYHHQGVIDKVEKCHGHTSMTEWIKPSDL